MAGSNLRKLSDPLKKDRSILPIMRFVLLGVFQLLMQSSPTSEIFN